MTDHRGEEEQDNRIHRGSGAAVRCSPCAAWRWLLLAERLPPLIVDPQHVSTITNTRWFLASFSGLIAADVPCSPQLHHRGAGSVTDPLPPRCASARLPASIPSSGLLPPQQCGDNWPVVDPSVPVSLSSSTSVLWGEIKERLMWDEILAPRRSLGALDSGGSHLAVCRIN
ncbi:unnamed protein product [Pleuronectes platessa]|uniref:Uncharacterized protein n=1 Tax=Pleuronectes platessa TaxID=8262 RepID=A0A9N7YTU7_PLEPL|nr:unnamed protein product [Pleuronectes platessa]